MRSVSSSHRRVYDLFAYDARTGELIDTFLVAPELTISVGRGLTLAPSIVYIDPASGAESMVSSYDSVAGTVTARLPHFSHYTATFAAGVWEITLPTGVNEVLIAVSGGDLVVTIDGEVESQAIAGLTSLTFIGAEAGDDFDFDPSTAGLTVPIKLSNSQYSLGGFVHVSGDIDFGTPAFVDSNVGSGHLLVSLTINNATAFIGSGYGTPGQIGFSATLDSFAGALLVDTTGGREWHALTADFSLLTFSGIDDLSLALTDLDVELNSRASDGSVVDWTTVTGATPPISFTGCGPDGERHRDDQHLRLPQRRGQLRPRAADGRPRHRCRCRDRSDRRHADDSLAHGHVADLHRRRRRRLHGRRGIGFRGRHRAGV